MSLVAERTEETVMSEYQCSGVDDCSEKAQGKG